MKRLVLIGIALIAGRSAFATVFPDKDGSHDFTSAAAWGGTLPTSAEFSGLTGTYNAAAGDATFTTFTVSAGSKVVFDLLNTPMRKIRSTGGTTSFSFSGSGTEATILGGSWTSDKNISLGAAATDGRVVVSNATVTCNKIDILGSRNRIVFTGADARLSVTNAGTYSLFGGCDGELLLTDGASWQHDNNSLYLTISSAATNNVFRVANGASFGTETYFYAGYYKAECSNRLEVVNGGHFAAKNLILQRDFQQVVVSNATVELASHISVRGFGNRFVLSGPKMEYQFPHSGTFSLFSTYSPTNYMFEVTNGAIWEFNTNNVYTTAQNTAAPCNCTFRLSDGGKFLTSQHFYLGYSASESSNRVEVLDGGELRVKSITLDKDFQSLLVDNGKVECTGTAVKFADASRGCRLAVSGTRSELKFASLDNQMFAGGRENEVVISDGATWAYAQKNDESYYTSINSSPHHNLLRIERNGRLTADCGFYIGYNMDATNRVEVLDGGCVVADLVALGGVDNSLIVSNGTVSATNGNINVGKAWGSNNRGARLVLSGTSPKMEASTYCQVVNGGAVRFAVPPEGYAVTPITAGSFFKIEDGTTITIDADAFQQGLKSSRNVVLAEWGATQGTSISASVLAAANAELEAKRMQLVVEDKKLVLKVRPVGVGMMIFVR